MQPEILARVTFFETNAGGRAGPTPHEFFGCIFKVDEKMNDCHLLLSGIGSVKPGQTVDVPIKFLCLYLLEGRLVVRKKSQLRDGGIVAEGEILKVFDSPLEDRK